MSLNETVVTEAILDAYCAKFKSALNLDVAIVGGGPSGLTAARKLAEGGFNVASLRAQAVAGRRRCGAAAMTWNMLVVQEESRHLLDEVGVPLREHAPGYLVADAVTAVTVLAARACLAGAKVFNCLSVEDVVLREEDGVKRIAGLVVNSSPVEIAGLHVDPVTVAARYVVEATGHAVEVLKTLTRKNEVKLFTRSGRIEGEQSLWAERAEADTMLNTREVFPGLYVAGMAANAAFGSYRMGPIFGGMLLSGEKVAADIAARLKAERTA